VLKKRHVIMALGVVSVLLVSLFTLALAGDITPSGKPQPQPAVYKNSLSISLLRVASSGWGSQGVAFVQPVGVYEIPFAFNPTETLLNVTNLWVSYIYGTYAPNTINIYLNDILAATHYYDNAKSIPFYTSSQVTETNIHNALNSGINVLSLEVTNTLYLQELTIFIEYEYQA